MKSLRLGLSAICLILALGLTGCATADQDWQGGGLLPDYDPTPQTVVQPADVTDAADLWLPLQLEDQLVLDPGWQTPPAYADGVFLSASDHENVLTFTAADDTGQVLWQAERPLSCTGFTLTTTQHQTVAVLTDIDDTHQGFGHTVANGYDLHTGEALWGPVDVPGAHQGPGTVFAAPPQAAMGSTEPRLVLDPASGAVLLDESTEPEVRILGEFNGLIVLVYEHTVIAYDAAQLAEHSLEAQPVWTLDPAPYSWDLEALQATVPASNDSGPDQHGAVLLGDGLEHKMLLDLSDGRVIAEDVATAMQDPSSGTWVTLGQQRVGYDRDGTTLYQLPGDGLTFAGIGGAMVYLENTAGDIAVHNVVTGALGRAYDPSGTGELAVPAVITANGAAVVEAAGRYYLVAVHDADE